MLSLLFDVTSLMRRDLTGIGVYASNLYSQLRSMPDVELRGCWKLDRYARRGFLRDHIDGDIGPYIPFLTDANLHGWHVFHGPDFRIPKRGRFAKVVTIHDMAIHEPGIVDERFAREGIAKMKRTLLECGPSRIITVSEFTRSRLLEQYPALEPIVRTVPLGVDAARFAAPADDRRVRELVPGPYLLSVGSVEKRKNLANTIRAFELVRRAHPGLTLLVAGGGGHGTEEIDAAIAHSPASAAIRRLGFVDNALLAALYRHAICFVYPSLYEGFGLPVLEAMAAGAPVVTSNCGALAEVSGGAALTADPTAPDAIAAAVLEIIDDDARRAALVHAGREHAATFTWRRTAEATVEIYRDAQR